jgi:hypothetical protein
MEAEARNGLRRTVGLLMVVALLGLVSSGCARVQSHFALPDLAMGDPAFGPTIEAYTATRAHILLDGFGALQMPAAYRETMTKAGCEVATFRPLSPLISLSPFGFGRENNRSHRRILVVDGRVGFTGGVGVSPEWLGNGRKKGHWRQTDVRIEGPAVASLQSAFVENWPRRPATCSAGARTSRVQPRADR